MFCGYSNTIYEGTDMILAQDLAQFGSINLNFNLKIGSSAPVGIGHYNRIVELSHLTNLFFKCHLRQ